jgi:two-component system, response regulator
MLNERQVVDVLLVEDDPSDAKLTMRALKNANLANDVYLVKDGEEALDFLFCRNEFRGRSLSLRPKVVLLDIKLPKIDGMEVLRQIRNDERLASLPVVLLTSSRQDRDILAGYGLHANSYVVKPVTFGEFSESVKSLGMYWLLINTPPIASVPAQTEPAQAATGQ